MPIRNALSYRIQGSKKAFIRRQKTACADCKTRYPYYVLQFDHVRDEKKFNLAIAHVSKGWEQIEKEIAKCDVVCGNCHAERTHQRKQRYKGGAQAERHALADAGWAAVGVEIRGNSL